MPSFEKQSQKVLLHLLLAAQSIFNVDFKKLLFIIINNENDTLFDLLSSKDKNKFQFSNEKEDRGYIFDNEIEKTLTTLFIKIKAPKKPSLFEVFRELLSLENPVEIFIQDQHKLFVSSFENFIKNCKNTKIYSINDNDFIIYEDSLATLIYNLSNDKKFVNLFV